ncbi:hypothetical protein PINS_up013675 [Pythium insidiosum]|nr:hypothetical protein PINS_up013675 [Pythium insidiosum]
MGSAESKAVVEAVRGTALSRLPAPVPILDTRYCLTAPQRTFLVQHKTSGSEMTVTAHDYTDQKKGARVFRMKYMYIYFDVYGVEDSDYIVRVRPTQRRNFSVELPLPVKSQQAPTCLYTLKHVLKENEPVVVGVVKDALTGHAYHLGYTGVWRHGVVIWLASEKTPEQRTSIAKTYPSGRVGIQVNYCLEVAQGVDVAALMTMITVMDMGLFGSSGGLGVSLGVGDGC